MENPYSAVLCHHGILGQRWGKRNGPPYPLDAGDHSASERKAGWRKSVKSMSDDELRQKINRKRLENDYNYWSSKVGDSRKANDVVDMAKKGIRVAANTASVVAKKKQLKNQDKIDNIDDKDKNEMSKAEKKAEKAKIRRGENIANATSQALYGTANSLQNMQKNRINLDKTDISKMSDAELRKRVNRLMLEAQYEDAYHINKGKETAEKILDAAGTVTQIAGTAISIAILLKGAKPAAKAAKAVVAPAINLVKK